MLALSTRKVTSEREVRLIKRDCYIASFHPSMLQTCFKRISFRFINERTFVEFRPPKMPRFPTILPLINNPSFAPKASATARFKRSPPYRSIFNPECHFRSGGHRGERCGDENTILESVVIDPGGGQVV